MEVVFGGDFYPGRRWEEKIINNASSIWSDEVVTFFHNADLRIVNLETPLTVSNNPIKKTGPNLKCHPDIVKTLKHANIDLVTLANNHIYDFGDKGLKDTIKILNDNKIDYIGVGEDKITAGNSIFEKEEVVFLNYSHNEWGAATDKTSGFNSYSIIDITNRIKHYKKLNKCVCLILHRGHEHFSFPSPNMVEEFRFFVDNGADLIITHHSHFYSGFEKYKNGHIFYGLGNMLFDSSTKDERWFESFLLKINFQNKKIKDFKILPINHKVENGKILISNEEKFFLNQNLINQIIKNQKLLENKWLDHVSFMELSYLLMLQNKSKYILSLVKRAPFFKKYFLRETNNTLILQNYFNCEAHQEAIKQILNK